MSCLVPRIQTLQSTQWTAEVSHTIFLSSKNSNHSFVLATSHFQTWGALSLHVTIFYLENLYFIEKNKSQNSLSYI